VISPRATDRIIAVPSLGERGGGVGQVSTLLWNVARDSWPDASAVLPLCANGNVQPTSIEKLRFGARLAAQHLWGPPAWVLFGHLGLTQARRYVPAARRVPYAVFLHGVEAWKPLDAHRFGALQNARLRIANSEFTARQVALANPGLGDIAVCPLSLTKGASLSSVMPATARRPVVLMVGRLATSERYKGHDRVIAAWPAVKARVPDAELAIVGDGDDVDRLQDLARKSGVAESVRFAGFLDRQQLEAEYATAALLTLPSRGEGFGLVYLEAMAHGLPCVGSTHDAGAEVIGDAGLTVDPDDLDAVAAAIVALLESPERRQQMGDAGHRRVQRYFTYDRFRRDLTLLLRQAFPDSEAI
jgi:phosphatidylinositol alpha-1,6-mannosyltransferase